VFAGWQVSQRCAVMEGLLQFIFAGVAATPSGEENGAGWASNGL